MSFVFVCLVSILCTSFSDASDCPDLWIPFHGSCYLFGHQSLPFFEAEHYCETHHGAHLVKIDTHDANSFIKDHISHDTDRRWWIGLTDDSVEGLCVWYVSNDKPEFTDWAPGEPNGAQTESCAEMASYGTTFHWNDAPCTAHKPMICQKPTGDGANIDVCEVSSQLPVASCQFNFLNRQLATVS